jgi:hypothetical protein
MKKDGEHIARKASDNIAALYRANLSIAQPAIPLQEECSLTTFMKSQHEFNQKLVEQLERMEQRQIERDQQLMQAIRSTQEIKK